MKYSNTNIRRRDRLLDEAQATELLKKGEYGIFSVQAEEGGAYGIPINYAWDGKQSIYLHCAPEGRKLRCIKICNRVSFCIVGHTQVISNKFSTAYESIVLFCFFTGIGNAATFRQFPIIFGHNPRQAAVVIGWTAAIAAYGPFIFATIIGTGIALIANAKSNTWS
jgi:hypothetical protein